MTVCVRGLADRPDVPAEHVLTGVFEMVAVDSAGRPVAIDSSYLNPETSHEHPHH
jgi:acyl-CoA hydrolase